MVPWGYLPYEIKFHILSEEVDLVKFVENGAWELKETHVMVKSISQFDADILLVTFTLKRRWGFHLISMLLPIGTIGASEFVSLPPTC